MSYRKDPGAFDRVMSALAKSGKQFVLNVGAFDGQSFDPTHKHIVDNDWPALMIEPLACNMHKLQEAYAGCSNIIFEQTAIADYRGVADVHSVAPELEKYGLVRAGSSTFASLHRPDVRDWPLVQVTCCLLEDVLSKHQVDRIDVVKIDTEGMDWVVLKQLDLSRYRPAVIQYEAGLLSPEDNALALDKLLSNGYQICHSEWDVCGTRLRGMCREPNTTAPDAVSSPGRKRCRNNASYKMSITLTKEVLRKYLREVFFETGTHDGGGVEVALAAGFRKVYTCDLDSAHVRRARNRFPPGRVQVYKGDSRQVLAAVLPRIKSPVTFWLDAHDYLPAHRPTPLWDELSVIVRCLGGVGRNAILIDDLRCLGAEGTWGEGLSVEKLLEHITRLDAKSAYAFEDSRLAKNDILAVWGAE
jgi:FkbM family methyltransferase